MSSGIRKIRYLLSYPLHLTLACSSLLLLGQKNSPLWFHETNEIISACIAALPLKTVCIAKTPICLHVLVHVWP